MKILITCNFSHVIKYYYFFDFFFNRNIETGLSSQAVPNQVAGWVDLQAVGPIPALE